MPRDITVQMDTDIQQPVTAPNYLVELLFAVPLRYATLKTVNWNSLDWYASGCKVASVSADYADLSLFNSNSNGIGALILNTRLHGIGCNVYTHYGTDAELLFSGRLDGSPGIAEWVSLSAVGESRAAKYPDQFIVPPTFNHLMAPGTEIRIGSTTLVLEEARS